MRFGWGLPVAGLETAISESSFGSSEVRESLLRNAWMRLVETLVSAYRLACKRSGFPYEWSRCVRRFGL